ncbi:MAG: UvrD-helicase domain-containing protein, partial [Lachnospiraceae bacterium]|nr:UvrD-helicase domain-containing protein [Lachnospiraceae bacterium]
MSKYDKLNEQQKDAVFTVDGPMLILAGAGSGKTSVITNRIAYLIEEAGVEPYNILAITFTNKAAGEMRERVDKLVGFGAEQIFVSTFHSMCVRMLRRHIDRLGYDNNFTIYDTDDQKQIVKEVCKKLQIDTKVIKEKTIMNAISSCKDELVTPDQYYLSAMGDFQKQKIASAYREYQAALVKNNALDFDDLLMKTVELFKAEPEVLKNYQNRFRYIMVDEYQDTNTAQFELIRLLAGSLHNLCVVGDDDQSIYKFRGANIRNILDFEKYFPEAKVVKLEQNYRSVQNILDAANSVIRNNASRKDKSLWSKKPEGERIHFRRFDTAYEEAEYVVDEIKSYVNQGDSLYNENAILYRTNAQSRMIEEKLVKSNVPYVIVGGINFYSRREIKDLLAYLKTIDNARDDVACRRIINVPKRGIGATSVTKLQAVADERGVSFFDAVCHPEWADIKGSTADKLKSFANMIFRFRAINEEMGPKKCLTEVLDVSDYISQMECDSEEEAEERVENIEELVSKVASYEEEHEDATLSGLLEDIALVADIDEVDDSVERTLLMTIHSAKGLEFKNVFLIGMEDG